MTKHHYTWVVILGLISMPAMADSGLTVQKLKAQGKIVANAANIPPQEACEKLRAIYSDKDEPVSLNVALETYARERRSVDTMDDVFVTTDCLASEDFDFTNLNGGQLTAIRLMEGFILAGMDRLGAADIATAAGHMGYINTYGKSDEVAARGREIEENYERWANSYLEKYAGIRMSSAKPLTTDEEKTLLGAVYNLPNTTASGSGDLNSEQRTDDRIRALVAKANQKKKK